MRNRRDSKTVEADLSKPLTGIAPDGTCFGKEWDMKDKDCQYCADNEICGILFATNVVKAKVKEVESKNPIFLDQTDFSLIDKKLLIQQINGLTTSEFVAIVKKQARTEDDVAAVEWIKRFVRDTDGLSIINGVVKVS